MTRRASIVCLLMLVTASACSDEQRSASADAAVPGLAGRDVADAQVEIAEVDTVVMIGDSITVASRDALETMYAGLGFDDVVIVAQQGKRIALSFGDNPSGASVASALLDGTAMEPGGEVPVDLGDDHTDELWVVALGTNDIEQYSDPAERVAAINELLRIVPADVPLIWVDTYFRDRPEGAAEINEMIAARLAARGNATVAPWSAVAGDEGNLRDDGVHPRDAGSVAFADVIRATIAE